MLSFVLCLFDDVTRCRFSLPCLSFSVIVNMKLYSYFLPSHCILSFLVFIPCSPSFVTLPLLYLFNHIHPSIFLIVFILVIVHWSITQPPNPLLFSIVPPPPPLPHFRFLCRSPFPFSLLCRSSFPFSLLWLVVVKTRFITFM